jgi:UDP:flavonoid glycosyltransferase YjiC (YdhE family)
MKKILVMPDGNWLSHVSRPFEISKILREKGYNVLFASDGHYMKLPREKGFQVLSIKTISPDHVLKCSRSGRANWYDYKLLKECVEEDLKLFDRVKPDLVLNDFRLSLSTSCELAGIPLAVTLNAAWTNYYDVRIKAPEHLGITQILGKQFTTFLAPLIKDFILTFDCIPYNKFRREKGLNKRKNIWDIFRGDLNIIVDIPEYGPTKDLPSNFHYIGPIIWEPEIETPDWLERINPNRPTIYFTMGSTGHSRFFEQAIEIFKDSQYQCIMTTAGMSKLTSIPQNFFVVDYAPGSKIMEKSDVVVCQGGNGTIYQAMSKGVPIIGIPTMHDQEFNLDRVVDLGIGIHLSELKFKPAHLVEAVENILTQKSYKENANKYKNILEKYNGPQMGAELIDSYLKSIEK